MTRPLIATYRLQLNADFTLHDARARVPYLHALGVSHLYLSPVLTARSGSTHGYDVADPTRVSDALGGEEALVALANEAHALGMGLLVDIVPNHMGVGPDNPFWDDVLTHGAASKYADWFDVQWRAPTRALHGKVLLPVLGDTLAHVLERDELVLERGSGGIRVRYFEQSFPVDPVSLPASLVDVLGRTAAAGERNADDANLSVRGDGVELHLGGGAEPEGNDEWNADDADDADTALGAKDLSDAHDAHHADDAATTSVAGAASKVDEALKAWSAGADGRRRLAALLARQHYALAFWRTASRDLNYRRFFDVNELISLRVERADVFEATHRTLLRLVADGVIDGLRVDHIDGLLEPRAYLERLRSAVDERVHALHESDRAPKHQGMAHHHASPAHAQRFPILVEKILGADETLPVDWPVDGTTGYEFLVAMDDALIDPAGYAQLEARYRGAHGPDFHTVAVSSKRRVLRAALNADVRRIAPMLANVARAAGWPVRSVAAYAGAIVSLTSHLSVYRTYMDAERPDANEHDRAVLTEAFVQARAQDDVDDVAMSALEEALLGAWGHDVREPLLATTRLSFVRRWQQLTGPAAAKGVEDTALYVYAPLASRNEVGGDPGLPLDDAVQRLHGRLRERAGRFPRSLNATNTHDTKRSADVRARLDALSERPAEFERALRRWRRLQKPLRTLVNGRLAPLRSTERFIHQALIGVWPWVVDGSAEPADAQLTVLGERLSAYMQKALREAKVRTTWTDPDAEYEAAISKFIGRMLDAGESREFLRTMQALVRSIAPIALWNVLARLVVHMTAPGVPDLYQGDEMWFAALVDPDNRRAVEWAEREERLRNVACTNLEKLRDALDVDDLKLCITRALLGVRRDNGALLAEGSYAALEADGQHAQRVIAFERAAGGARMIVIVPRLTGAMPSPPVGDAWGDTVLLVPSGDGRFRCALTGAELSVAEGQLRVGDACAVLPVAVLLSDTEKGVLAS